MNSRTRRQSPKTEAPSYLRYLKPGALAQLRDSRINAHTRTHRVDSQPRPAHQISSPLRPATPPQIGPADGPPPSPCFSGRIYGPRCPQRKKLVAAKGFCFVGPSLSSHGPEPGPISDSSNHNNILVAH